MRDLKYILIHLREILYSLWEFIMWELMNLKNIFQRSSPLIIWKTCLADGMQMGNMRKSL